MAGHRKWSEIKRKSKFKVNDHVRILAYPEDSINAYGRVQLVRERGEKRYWVVNMNMPYSGTVSDYFNASELAHG